MGRGPSPYLDAVERSCREMSGRVDDSADSPERRRRGSAGVRSARARLAELPTRPAARLAEDADPELLASLRKWRAATARATGVPAYVIFHDSTLAALATDRPRTPEQLLGIPGLGPVKVSRYGTDLLALLSETAEGRAV